MMWAITPEQRGLVSLMRMRDNELTWSLAACRPFPSFRTMLTFFAMIDREDIRPAREVLLEILPGHAKLIERVALYKAKKALEGK